MDSETSAIRARLSLSPSLCQKKKNEKDEKRTKEKRKTDVAVSTKVRTTNNSSERSSAAPDRNSIPQGRQRVKMARPTRWNFWHAFFFILHCAGAFFLSFPSLSLSDLVARFLPGPVRSVRYAATEFSVPIEFSADQCPTNSSVKKKKKKKRRKQINSRVCVLEDRL